MQTAEMNSLCMKESSSDQRVSVLQAANNELESRYNYHALYKTKCNWWEFHLKIFLKNFNWWILH